MKADRGSSGVALFIVNLGTVWKWVVNFTPRHLYPWKRTPVPISLEPWLVPEPFWTLWKKKIACVCWIRTPDCPANRWVALSIFYGISCFAIVLFYFHYVVLLPLFVYLSVLYNTLCKYPYPQLDSNQQSQQASGDRLTPQYPRPPGSADRLSYSCSKCFVIRTKNVNSRWHSLVFMWQTSCFISSNTIMFLTAL